MPPVISPGGHAIATRHGLLEVQVQQREDGQFWAALARPQDRPELDAVPGAPGDSEYQAVARLRSALDGLPVERRRRSP